jgi:protein-tyrosine-phosphatase
MATAMLRHALPALAIASGGTGAVVGSLCHPNTVTVLTERGITPPPERARQLTPALLRSASLVLTMTAEQRTWCIGEEVFCADRAFTVLELAKLLRAEDHCATAGELAGLASGRLRALTRDLEGLNVTDPIGLPLEVYEHVYAVLDAGLAPVVRALG